MMALTLQPLPRPSLWQRFKRLFKRPSKTARVITIHLIPLNERTLDQ
jgi:hypothetical protein